MKSPCKNIVIFFVFIYCKTHNNFYLCAKLITTFYYNEEDNYFRCDVAYGNRSKRTVG